ncbi:MAG: RNase adapter RapZ [Xanthomonadales bacterium]|nr:RNase adapter RapZ [Xanthomonadales bacterium]
MNGPDADRHLVLITGLSGGGKSTALHAIEDLGYYCVDNLPAALLPEFATQIKHGAAIYARVALGVDARSPEQDLREIPAWLEGLSGSGIDCRMLFLDADSKAIIKRFSETRRRHPLTSENRALPQAIEREIALLAGLRQRADWVIDTSDTNIHQLRRQVWKCVDAENDSMTIVLESFAFKRGVPQDVDFIFDARILPNPHWVDGLRNFSGLDEPVRKWLDQDESVERMITDVLQFLKTWLPEFRHSQRTYVTVGIGCTGGRHRSVYLVDRLAQGLGQDFGTVLIHHRELQA